MTPASLAAAQRQVLYVEHDAVHRLVMEAILRLRSHLRVIVAHSGRHACEIAAGLHPALLLLDQRLPDCHGDQLLSCLRSRARWEAVPAIVLTVDPGFRSAGTPFAEVWCKPLDRSFVLERLDAALPAIAHADGSAGSSSRRSSAA